MKTYKTPLFDVLDLDAKIILNEAISESQNIDFGNEDGVEIPV